MRHSASTHRLLAATTGLALLVGLAAATPATAAEPPLVVTDAFAGATIASGNEGVGAEECTVDAQDVPVQSPGDSSGQTQKRTGTVTHNTDPADVTTMSTSSTISISASVASGSVKRLALNMKSTFTLDAALGADTRCAPQGVTLQYVQAEFQLAAPGWITLASAAPSVPARPSSSELTTGISTADGTLFKSASAQSPFSGTRSERFFLEAGSYAFFMNDIYSKLPPEPGKSYQKTSSTSARATLTFAPAGSAKGAAITGSGRSAVRFGAAVNCSKRSLDLTWRKPARQVEKAQIRVNGRLVRTVRHPKPGRHVKLTKIARTKPTTVVVKVGRKTAKRTYLACG